MKEKELEFDNKINEVLSGVLDNVEPAEQEGLSEDAVNINLEATDEKPSVEEVPKPQEEEEPINAAELFKDKYYQEKKKRKAILADRQKLEQENQELKQYLNGTISVNSELYEKDIQNDIDKLSKIMNDAIEGGHPDVFVQANPLLALSGSGLGTVGGGLIARDLLTNKKFLDSAMQNAERQATKLPFKQRYYNEITDNLRKHYPLILTREANRF